MLIVSTTALGFQGDDFIRDGVRQLIAPKLEQGELWVNRFGCRLPDGTHSSHWRLVRNMPSIDECMSECTAFVMAGTPGWGKPEIAWYDAAVRHGKPIWLIGIGGSGKWPEGELAPYANAVAVATVRDDTAHKALDRAGIPHRRFIDPAFHAPYMKIVHTHDKRFDTVLTYKAATKQDDAEEHRAAYRALYERFRERIACVLVHECGEIVEAHQLFGVRPFFSSEPRRYVDIYAQAQHYIGGRFHGAVATIATGGEAHVLYSKQNHKTEGLSERWMAVRCYAHAEHEKVAFGLYRPTPMNLQQFLEREFVGHAAYVRGCMNG